MQKPRLFTLFVEFGGGTFISQISSISPEQATLSWFKMFDWSVAGENDAVHIRNLQDSVLHGKVSLTPISGTSGVWCASGLLGDRLWMAHIIETVMG